MNSWDLGETLFSPLFDFCRACGIPATAAECPSCGEYLDGPDLHDVGGLGAWVTQRKLFRTHEYVVIGGDAHNYEVLGHDGQVGTIPISNVDGFQQSLEGEWSLGGALLAVSLRPDLADELRAKLRQAALDKANTTGERRGLLQDAIRLGQPDVIGQLDVTSTEAEWVRAVWDASEGRLNEATRTLLGLPSCHYTGKLAVWYLTAVRSELDGDLVDAVAEELEVLADVSPVVAVACSLLLGALPESRLTVEGMNSSVSRVLSDPVHGPQWREAISSEPWLRGESSASRLLQALSSGDSAALGDDPAILDDAPGAVLDDLIDDGLVPDDWLEAAERLDAGGYLLARMDPANAPDSALVEAGADNERARRAFLRGEACPADVSEDARERYDYWTAVAGAGGPSKLAAALKEVGDPLASELEEALRSPNGIPSKRLLDDELLAKSLSEVSEVEVASLDAKRLSGSQREFIGLVLTRRAKAHLLDWDWQDALETAKEALRFARQEQLRDEALNLLACAQWQLGLDEEALAALETALAGDYTEALQTNIAVVAAELKPESAAEHLARLVVEAPDLALRVSAARRAISIWGFTDEPWASEDQLPASLAKALRLLVTEPIPLEDFGDIVRLLADYDSKWLASRGRLSDSPHADTDEAKVWVARAKGFPEFAKALRIVLQQPDAPDWAVQHRDDLVNAAVQVLAVEDPPINAVAFGMAVLDNEVPVPPENLAVLRAFVARGVAMRIDPSEGEPADKFLEWLERAAKELQSVPAELRQNASEAVAFGFHYLAAAYLQSRFSQLRQAAELHDMIVGQIGGIPRRRLNMGAVREAAQPIRQYCRETTGLMNRLKEHVTDDDLNEGIDELMGLVRKLDEHARKLG